MHLGKFEKPRPTFFQIYIMTGRKNRAPQVPPVVPYKALEKFPKALYGTTGGTCSARFLCPVMSLYQNVIYTAGK